MKLLSLNQIQKLSKSKPSFAPNLEGLYFLFDEDEIVYIGRTSCLFSRLASHMYKKEFDSFAYIKAVFRDSGKTELAYIKKFKPRYNMYGNSEPLVKTVDEDTPDEIFWKNAKAIADYLKIPVPTFSQWKHRRCIPPQWHFKFMTTATNLRIPLAWEDLEGRWRSMNEKRKFIRQTMQGEKAT